MFTIYSADRAGVPSNCLYPHKANIKDDSDLKAAVLNDYVCAEYKNNYRKHRNKRSDTDKTIQKIPKIG